MDEPTTTTSGRLRVLGHVVLFMFGCAFVLALCSGIIPKLPGMWSELCLGCATSVIAIGLTALFVRWDGVNLSDVGATPERGSPLRFLMGFLIGSCIVSGWALLCIVSGYVRWTFQPTAGGLSAYVALTAYLALACREELSFHGYPLRRLQQTWGVWSGQVFVAIVFALEHRLGGSPWVRVIFGAFVGSLLFGMASIATRGLAVPIGVHAAWNFGTWLLGMKGQGGVWRQVVEPGNERNAEIFGMAAYVAVLGTAIFLFWNYFRRTSNVRSGARN
ncbi:MAG TPA: CPBP family intramembrane glutamic endopeptidase [Lacipirellulaceae bacterium]|nr:CPBP family intramembrane glutamic endopeptidase [Lacipirellulaceae bacterium]